MAASKCDLTIHQIENELDILDFQLLDSQLDESADCEYLRGQIEGLRKAIVIVKELG